MGFPRRLTDASAAYCPLFLRTWSQAALILERCSLRHARMVKSPWSITGRQNFCTSRVQAFCSSAVPLRLLLGEGSGRNRDRQQGECEEKFTHRIPSFRQQEILFPICASASPERICLDGRRRVTQQRVQDKHGKCGQIYGDIYGDLSTLNNRLISNVYFCHTFLRNWLLQTMRRIARCCADGAGVNVSIPLGRPAAFSCR